MSLLSTIEDEFGVSEQWVMTWLTKIGTGLKILEADAESFWTWVAAHSAEISNDAATVTTGLSALKAAGIPVPQVAITAINEMNVAVTSINAAVAAQNSGATAVGTFVSGFTAAKSAQAAVANAAGAIVAALPQPPAPPPVPASTTGATQGSGG